MNIYQIKVRTQLRYPDSEPELIVSEGKGLIWNRDAEQITIEYTDDDGDKKIIYKRPDVTQINKKSSLHMRLDNAVDNHYQTDYGTLAMTIVARRMHVNLSMFNLVYDIYQNDDFVERVILRVRWRLTDDEAPL